MSYDLTAAVLGMRFDDEREVEEALMDRFQLDQDHFDELVELLLEFTVPQVMPHDGPFSETPVHAFLFPDPNNPGREIGMFLRPREKNEPQASS